LYFIFITVSFTRRNTLVIFSPVYAAHKQYPTLEEYYMKNVRNILVVVLATVALGMTAGCGSDHNDTYIPPTATKSTSATVAAAPAGSPAGSVATTTAVTAPAFNGTTAVTIPAGTVITPSFGGTLAAGPITVNVTNATIGTTAGMKAPTGKILASALGAVDISIAGINGFTVPAPGLTVNISVTSCPSATGVPVTVVRYDGSSSNTTGTCSSNLVTVTGITQFSSVLVSPVFTTGS
jgi:hypothetical protein